MNFLKGLYYHTMAEFYRKKIIALTKARAALRVKQEASTLKYEYYLAKHKEFFSGK